MEQSVTLERFSATVISEMTPEEAERAEYEIIATGNRMRAQLVEFYERRGWAARGYSSVRAWLDAVSSVTFGLSRVHLLRELIAGQIETELVPIGTSIGATPESHLRPLAPLRNDPDLLRDTWEDAHELASERGEKFTARHVEEAVEAARPKSAPIAFDPPAPMAVHFSSATPEHYSPAHIVEMAREVLNTIDLDPASCAQANETIQATAWYGLDHPHAPNRDGFAHPWVGRIWLNPPYGDEIAGWMERLVHQYAMENVIEAIALVPARTDTAWFRSAAAGRVVCFVRGRLKFGNAENSAPFPSALIYFGEDADKFRVVFAPIGLIATFDA